MNNDHAFAEAKAFLDTHERFVVISHASTDGDDLGTVLAFTSILKHQGKIAIPAAIGGVPPSLKFLTGQQDVVDGFPLGEFDALILSGCGNVDRPRMPEIAAGSLPILNIDHHPDNTRYGTVNIVDPSKSSVAELTFDFFKYAGYEITPDISKALLTGIFTDTGSFMHANTTSGALLAAGKMVQAGARTDKIYSHTQNKDLTTMKAWSIRSFFRCFLRRIWKG
jgi:phosphoesterase RecJ-like protein